MGEVQGNQVSIDIRAIRGAPELQHELYLLDAVQDGRLEEQDLTCLFGATLAVRHSGRLVGALAEKDYNAAKRLIADLPRQRLAHFTGLWRDALKPEALRQEAAKVDATGQIDLSAADEQQLQNVARLVLRAAAQIYMREGVLPKSYQVTASDIAGTAKFLSHFEQDPNVKSNGWSLSYEGLAAFYNRRLYLHIGERQRAYAAEENYERIQSPQQSKLEEQYGIDLRSNAAFTSAELFKLEAAFARLNELGQAPSDHIRNLSFHDESSMLKPRGHEWHGVSYTRNRSLVIRKALLLDNPELDHHGEAAGIYMDHSQRSALPHYDSALLYVLTHELGHLVGGWNQKIFNQYEQWFGTDHNIDQETFAEDYAAFLLSGGQQVMRYRQNGRPVPYLAERLSLLKKHVSVSTPKQKETNGMPMIVGDF